MGFKINTNTNVAENGLTKVGSNIQLGGSLIQATNILFGANNFTETINGAGGKKIIGSGTASGSASTGGFLNFTQTGDGAGLVMYTTRNLATVGHLLHLNVNSGSVYNRQALRIDYIGGSNASTIYNKNTNQLNSVALNVVSDNVTDSTAFFSGRENSRGTVKITHNNSSGTATGDVSAAGISIDLQDNETPYSLTANIATATATVTAGVVTALTLVNGGSGYPSTAPILTITGVPAGTGATATATVTAGVVTALTLVNGGSGYTGTANVTIGAPTHGTSCQGIFMTSTSVGGYNGNMLQFRNNKGYHNSALSLFRIDSEGRAIFTPALSGTQAFQVGLQSQAFNSYALLTNGVTQWGSGTATFDTRLSRLSGNILKIDWVNTQSASDNSGRLAVGSGANGSSVLTLDGAIGRKIQSTGINLTLDALSDVVFLTANVTITLPLASTCIGRQYTIVSDYAGGGIINPQSPDLINGATTYTAITARYQRVSLISSGSNWIVLVT